METSLPGKRVTVMGLGRFGGGVGVTRWLINEGATVLLTDCATESSLASPLAELRDLEASGRLSCRIGSHEEDDFTEADLVVVNPAVPRPWEHHCLQAAAQAHVRITTEIRLLVEQLDRSQVIGITGTAGKSTTAAMIHHILRGRGLHPHLGGNIGGTLLETQEAIRPEDPVVLELSSFMLYWLGKDVMNSGAAGWSPGMAILTNLEENHLDWHGSMDHYRACKEGIFRFQRSGEEAVRGMDHDPVFPTMRLNLLGAHNQGNARLACEAAGRFLRCPATDLRDSLENFHGLPHRLERIDGAGPFTYVNDSKATTPSATVHAVHAIGNAGRIHLIAGGYDKQVDLQPLSDLSQRVAQLYTIGETGAVIAGAVPAGCMAIACDSLPRAIDEARDRMRDGDILLLSPGCASLDQYPNFMVRGDVFRECVCATPRPTPGHGSGNACPDPACP